MTEQNAYIGEMSASIQMADKSSIGEAGTVSQESGQEKPKPGKKRVVRPVDKVHAPSLEQVNIILQRCACDEEYMVVLLGWNLGLRSMEISLLKVFDFDFRRGLVLIRREACKGGYSHGPVPLLSSSFAEEVSRYIERKGLQENDYVLNYGASRKPYTTRHIRRLAKNAGVRAGFPGFHTHMLRHSVARWLLEHNYNLNFVKRFLRHTNVRMTADLYGDFDVDDMLRIVSVGAKPVLVQPSNYSNL